MRLTIRRGVQPVNILTNVVNPKLKCHLLAQDVRLGSEWQDNGLIFTTFLGTPLNISNLTAKHFKPALKRADILRSTSHLRDVASKYRRESESCQRTLGPCEHLAHKLWARAGAGTLLLGPVPVALRDRYFIAS